VSAFIDERREDFGVEPICQTLGVSASAYYQRATGERSQRVVEDERLVEVIQATREANYFGGSRHACGHGERRIERLSRAFEA
jgi:putative transposase